MGMWHSCQMETFGMVTNSKQSSPNNNKVSSHWPRLHRPCLLVHKDSAIRFCLPQQLPNWWLLYLCTWHINAEHVSWFSQGAVRRVLYQLFPFSHILQIKYEQPPCLPDQKQLNEIQLCLCQLFKEEKKRPCSLQTWFVTGVSTPGSLLLALCQPLSELDRWK